MNTYDKQIDKLWNEFYTMRKNRYLILNYLVSIKFRITKNSIPASTINACIKVIVNEGKLINKIKKVLELQSYSSLDMISDISNIIKLISDKNDYICVLVYNNVNNDFEMDTSSFDDAIKEGYCVRKNYFRWEVFFRERGKEYDCVCFPSESNALQYLFDKLYSIYVK